MNEEWCLGCHLCEYFCAFVNSGEKYMPKAFALNRQNVPNITVEEGDRINFAVNCRQCDEPLCKKGCITGAISVKDGVVTIDTEKCVGCFTCILSCPYGAVVPNKEGKAAKKCELCISNGGIPACVTNCPNRAIVLEEVY